MKLKEIKQVSLFKFTNERHALINIYVEPTVPGQGRLIISTNYHIFQRFFDGCNPDIFTFLSKQTAEMVCGCFDRSDEPFAANEDLTNYDYLMKSIAGIWPLFIEAIREKIDAENKAKDPGTMELSITIVHVEGDNYTSTTTFPEHAKANLVTNWLRMCADILEEQLVEKVKTMDVDNVDDAYEMVKQITIGELI